MSAANQTIEVTDNFNLFAPHLFHMGLDWAYRVRVMGEEIIGAAPSRKAAHSQAIAMRKRIKDIKRGKITYDYNGSPTK